MNRTIRLVLLMGLALGACAPGLTPPPELPEPDPPLGVEERAFQIEEAEAERAASEADAVVDDAAPATLPVNPGDFDIPIHVNERVLFWMEYFQNRHRQWFQLYLQRMGRYEDLIRGKLRERGMPQDLIYLALIESGFSPRAYSRARAVGIWQFIQGTARRYGLEVSHYVDERRDPVAATEAALNYLQDLYADFGSWYLAAAAYNSGEMRVERLLRDRFDGARGHDSLFWSIEDALPSETRNYVPKLLAAAILAKYRDRYGFSRIEPNPAESFDVVPIPDAVELTVLARAAAVSADELFLLNPHLHRGVTPPGRTFALRVPPGTGRTIVTAFETIPPKQRVRLLEHVVRRGETLSGIAARYGTTVAALQELNGIRRPRSLAAGRRLIISRSGGGAIPTTADLDRAAAKASPATGGVGVAIPSPGNDGSAADGHRGQSGSAQAAPPPRKQSSSKPRTYRVRSGDSLWSIAERFGVTVSQLRTWNALGSGTRIMPGQKLLLGPPGPRVIVYRVQPGDTLWTIARRHGVTTRQLMEWNSLAHDAVLRPGDRVEVRAGS